MHYLFIHDVTNFKIPRSNKLKHTHTLPIKTVYWIHAYASLPAENCQQEIKQRVNIIIDKVYLIDQIEQLMKTVFNISRILVICLRRGK